MLLFGLWPAAFGQTELIVNGDFTSTAYAPWQLSGVGIVVNNGLSMGNVNGAAQSVYQAVALPTNLIQATLSFEYVTVTSDSSGSDTMTVYITDTNQPPNVLATLGRLSNSNPTPSGTRAVFSANFVTYTGQSVTSSYSGKSVNVYFYASTDPSAGSLTSFDITDVRMVAGTVADVPPDDNFANATIIPAPGITNSALTTYASKETGEPNHAGNGGGRSVWWTWTAPATIGVATVNTGGSTFTTLLGVYTGSTVGGLTPVASNDGVNNSSGRASLKFDPVPGKQYYIALDGYNGQSGAAVLNFRFTQDKTPPSVAFTSPAAGALVTGSTITVHGTASDNVAVAEVEYRLENASGTNAFQTAAGTNSWSATIANLIPGPNTVRVEAIDTSGNKSAAAARVFNYVLRTPIQLTANGDGRISGATNGQLLNLGFKYSLVAEPAAGFGFKGWTGDISTNRATLSFIMESNASFTANFVDVQKPAVSVTAPLSGARLSNGVFTLTGKAKDNVGVSSVWYELNAGGWTVPLTTNQFANWDAPVSLQPGANQIQFFAEDAAGNRSATNVVNFTYTVSARLQLVINGAGVVLPNYNNTLLAVGRSLAMTATASKGAVFSNWMDNAGTVLTNGRTLKFTMASNLVFAANFVPNPFPVAAGTYQGLFYNSNGLAPGSSGFFTAQVNNNGAFTARFEQGTQSYPVTGQFSLTGGFTNTLKTWKGTVVSLQLDLNGGDLMTATLGNPSWTATLTADRAVYSKTNPARQADEYTLVLPGANSTTLPAGHGFGSVIVNSLGSLSFSGALGDGSKVTQATFLSKEGQWPFYASLYNGSGMILGWLTFTNETDRDIDGPLTWFKPKQASAVRYPAGFTNELEAAGSAYLFTKGAPVLNLANGAAIFEGGDLPAEITNPFSLASDNIITGSDKLSLKITTASGLFQGSTTNQNGRVISFSGAVLQKQNAGFGQFLGADQSGSVVLESQ